MAEKIKKKLQDSREERYKLLISARNFHYDNFSKWANYFYIAIGALFVAYYSIVTTPKDLFEKKLFSYVVLSLGFSCSLLWYWSSKGYYYWNINFISLVNNYESKILEWDKEERIYFVFANKKTQNNYYAPWSGANISTSKIAILFSYIITLSWGFLITYKILTLRLCEDSGWTILLSIFVSICLILILSLLIPKYILYSKIDHFPDLELSQKEE
ncbi:MULTISPECIES: hypothetical protein [unclassified Pedobacter]|uniref:RipA family octameric membrane protein n=1 Tax=unclassified Pedobacter TaxID=2628915 RepID=UPI001E0E4699|nr:MULTISPECIES: hypothetical protein [unclassified Pedobacter]CAH0137572.1 hypothetical protein SRABI126_00205 [Pedobacter sp. Bi126]CAH0220852.1 hypothetical protein SRABI36_02476 [Pedobacter sp. Bi36]